MFNLQMELRLGRKGRMSFHVWAVQLCLEYQSEARYRAAAPRDYLRNLVGPRWQSFGDQKVWDLCRKPGKASPKEPKSQGSWQSSEISKETRRWVRNQESLGLHVDFGLNINSLQRVMRINIFINHVCAHYEGENRPFKIHLHELFNSSLPFSARGFWWNIIFCACFLQETFPPQTVLLVSTFYWWGFESTRWKGLAWGWMENGENAAQV